VGSGAAAAEGVARLAVDYEGGESSIVNALALHQRLSETRPDLLKVLGEPFFYVKPRKLGEAVSWHGIPVFSWHEGYFKSRIVPDLIFLSQLTPEVPRFSAAQREALEVLLGLASAAEFKLDLRLEVHEAWFGSPSAGALRGGYLRERLGELAERDRA
jgi:hypothetical protein